MSKWVKFSITGLGMIAFIGIIFWVADIVTEKNSLQILIERFGVLGISLVALIANLNLIVPIHAATFTPLFLASGFSITTITIALAFGTTAADLLSYTLGFFGKDVAESKYPIIYKKVCKFCLTQKKYITPGIFVYSAFIPFPNEIAMIPLGVMGFKMKKILFPLILGTIVNQIIFALGFTAAFNLLF